MDAKGSEGERSCTSPATERLNDRRPAGARLLLRVHWAHFGSPSIFRFALVPFFTGELQQFLCRDGRSFCTIISHASQMAI